MNEEQRSEILASWATLPESLRDLPASEDSVAAFEDVHGRLPDEFRWFLTMCCGGPSNSGYLDSIDALWDSQRELTEGWGDAFTAELSDLVVVGWDSSGNPLAWNRSDGTVITVDHDFGGQYVLADSASDFLLGELTSPPPSKQES